MINTQAETSPQVYARIGGLAYLIIIVAALFGEMFVRNAIFVSGNPAATASNIMASPLLWRFGIAGDIIMHVFDLVLTIVYYLLFRRVNKNLALVSVLFGLIQTAVLVSNKLNLLMPLFLLGNEEYLKVFDPHQLQVLAYVSIKAHGHGFSIGLIFFGIECLIDGYLIIKSGFLPRVLGILILISGFCYLINSFILILFPDLSDLIFQILLLPTLIGELSMCLWLLFKGINTNKWKELET